MCVWSAYTGKRRAAEVLWESLRRIEGIWGGFYTGLVTLDQGVFRHEKILGNTRVWHEHWNPADFPGTCGLTHSRTDSGGDSRWSHPFLGSKGKVALVSQGSSGIFRGNNGEFERIGNMLLQAGRTFASADFSAAHPGYPKLEDGSCVHCSEVSAAAVEYYYEQLRDPVAALRRAFEQLPEEASSIALFSDLPGVIGFVNVNQRLVWQRNPDGLMLSLSTLAFPSAFGSEIPGNSVGVITPDSIRIEPLADRYPVNNTIPEGMCSACLEYVREHPGCHIAHLTDNVLRPHFPQDVLNYRIVAAYRILETLLAEKRVVLRESEVTGKAGQPGRIFLIWPAEG